MFPSPIAPDAILLRFTISYRAIYGLATQ